MNVKRFLKKYRIFLTTLLMVVPLLIAKYLFHRYHIEILPTTSLHSAVVSGTIFVVGFILSATIADYKESERIPSEFAATLENMYEDARALNVTYPKFDLEAFRRRLNRIAQAFGKDVRQRQHGTQLTIHKLNDSFVDMEAAGVPANFITRLKQQQFVLTHRLFRVNYIQRINFIPSASILARSITVLLITLLLLTEIDPFVGGMLIMAMLSFILIYIQRLVGVISTPFRAEGSTMDDVSLFLIDRSAQHLASKKAAENPKD